MRRPGDIKIICADRMVFYVDPVKLEPRSCSFYDAYAHTEPEPPEMDRAEWCRRHDEARNAVTQERVL